MYMHKWGTTYTTTNDYAMRKNLYLQTDAFIKSYKDPNVVLAHNKFSDWT
jgi:hypothetical protein